MNIQHVTNNVVDNVFLVDDASTLVNGVLTTPDGPFPAPQSGEVYMSQAGAGIGWTLSGGVLSAPAVTPRVLSKTELAAYANELQWRLATGGHTVSVAGTPRRFATDLTSQALITGKAVRFEQASPPASVAWQFESGFVTISAADFLTAAVAIADWVQSTFDALPAVLAAIASGSITTTAQVDSASWPTP